MEESQNDEETMFQTVGQFGPGQKRYYMMLSYLHAVCICSVMSTIYVDYTPEWTCTDNVDHYHKLNTSIRSACEYYDSGLCFADFLRPFESIVTEFDLMCYKSQFSRWPQILFFCGALIGNVACSFIGDVCGRRFLLLLSTLVLAILSVGTAIAWDSYAYIIIRFFCGVCSQGVIVGCSILLYELVGPKFRSRYLSYGQVSLPIGCLIVTLISACFTDWRLILIVISFLIVSPLYYLRSLPESPIWLSLRGYPTEAKEAAIAIAHANGMNGMSQIQPRLPKPIPHSRKVAGSFLSLYRSFSSGVVTSILLYSWFVIHLSYYSVTFSLGDRLGGQRHVNVVLSSALEVIVHLSVMPFANKYGRKSLFSIMFLLAGICLVACKFLPSLLEPSSVLLGEIVKIGLATLAKLSLAAILNEAYFYSEEMYSADYRNTVLGAVSHASHFGAVLSPLILTFENQTDSLLWIGILLVTGGVLAQALPETNRSKPLYDPIILDEDRRRAFAESRS